MTQPAPSFGQIRARVQAVRRKVPDARVVVLVVDVGVVVVLVVVDVLAVRVGGQAPHALPRPVDVPPAAAQAPSSWAMRAVVIGQFAGSSQAPVSVVQQMTASGLPQVERAAQRTMLRWGSLRQPDLRSALR